MSRRICDYANILLIPKTAIAVNRRYFSRIASNLRHTLTVDLLFKMVNRMKCVFQFVF